MPRKKTKKKQVSVAKAPHRPSGDNLTVTVHGSDGEPRHRIRVQISSARNVVAELLTSSHGEVEFSGLKRGATYYVRVNGEEAFEEVEIARNNESCEIEYDGEIIAPDDDEDKHPDEKDEEEDLDTVSDDFDVLI